MFGGCYWHQHNEGSEYGYLITKRKYEDYYLRAEFKWGDKACRQKRVRPGTSGILFYTVGEDKIWPTSIEFQLMEGGTGDIYILRGAALTVGG